MWRAEGKWLPRTSRKRRGPLACFLAWHGGVSDIGSLDDYHHHHHPHRLVFVMNNLVEGSLSNQSRRQTPGKYDDHGNSNGSHVKIFLPKKLLECLPKCSSLPKERHRWNTNEVFNFFLFR
ncbi:hypothetical protein GDO78_010938 [Eleutherodactylus coqui]|uniref:Uncharacterized protein n=1 Tax=Eleutherodactylus coqui TaxID=57060 RepID=A0A8J6F7K0_ELECQ|nr:hypothetical protein GDO78_010938 [Eleutherodactylus coqui]